ncbi:hypothetical protein SAMN05661091_3330 [Paenibacillus uliginis N3/975]|uniref:Prenylated flavin chaperone LpdD-like domain-containing protein n=1 Tax=Paenibacillus uliginis N3/975 TaxID=1313296 RepID=A0A1X7HGA4_9BACL|nr:hypothetical protein [Paenibacillus uliginis]SMF86217.1 hypothetical protein SAMN05661091_3330 [Paenibacillus uliginis N3/975]
MTKSFEEALTLEEIEIGRDTLIIIKGGDAHIGAVSIAYLTCHDPVTIDVETTSVPGHKEHLLSERFARHIAMQLLRTVTVVIGIHFDGLQRDEIDMIVRTTENMLEAYLAGKIRADFE